MGAALLAEPSPPALRWTAPQERLFDSPHALTVWWGANGIGKSQALAELARRAIAGDLHWQPTSRDGRTVMVVGKTWKQVAVVMEYFFAALPPGWFRPGVRFESGTVKGQRTAVYDVIGGPGKGGTLVLGVHKADNLAGFRAEVVLCDEPLPEATHNELWPRLFGRNGRMYVTFTPTIGTAHKVSYLWDLVDDPGRPWAGEIQTELSMEAVTVLGGFAPWSWVTAEQIAQLESGLSPVEVDLRMGRSRNPRLEGAYFAAWGPHLRLHRDIVPGTPIGVGIDHGSKPGAQRASLVAVEGLYEAARVHVIDHYRGDGRTESEDDARGILDMLARNGLQPKHIDLWLGDRAHRGDRRGGKKSNSKLRRALAEAMGLDLRGQWFSALPAPLRNIQVPRKWDGSVWEGCDVLHRMMVGGRFTISPRPECDPLDDDFASWTCRFTEPAKDGIDSVRYPAVPMVEGRRR